MQIAHPLVAEGVDQHSDFRADPWARLAGTLRSYLTIVYGTGSAARAEIARLNGLHRVIGGPVLDRSASARFGATYAARDPELSLWVHATLVDSTLATADAWLEPLSPDRRARIYAETIPVGRLFGVPPSLLPADVGALDRYVEGMLAAEGPVHPTATARELARAILRPPLAPVVAAGPIAARLGSSADAVAARAAPRARGRVRLAAGPGDRAPAARAARGVRAVLGRARAGDRRVAHHRVVGLAASPPGGMAVVPAGARG